MNLLKKIWCRVFQLGFRIALPILPYREPRILERIEWIPRALRKRKKRRPMIVTDKGITELGLGDRIKNVLKDAGYTYAYFDETVANPTIANVEAARELYLAKGCDSLIAIGGGSAMDCAKAVGARIARPDLSIQKMRGILKVWRPIPLLICVPTTAGTGSETTLAAVITDGESRYKFPVNDFFLIPDYAVLDPKITYSLPPHLTATTGMDALTHAVEAYIGRSTNRYTRENSERAVRLIQQSLKTAYDDPKNEKARRDMLVASFCAGAAFTRSYVGYVHGVAHSLGGQYGVPHGLANAVVLPYVLEDYRKNVRGKALDRKLAKLARIAGIVVAEDSDTQAAEQFIDWIWQMNESMGIPKKIDGIREADIPSMAEKADRESNPLYPVPVLKDAQELEAYYRLVMQREASAQN